MRFVNPVFVKFTRLVLLPIAVLLVGFHLLYLGRIYPGVEVAGTSLGGKTTQQAEELLSQIKSPETLVLTFGEEEFPISLSDLGFAYKFQETAKEASLVGRRPNLLLGIRERWNALTRGRTVPLSFTLNEEGLEEKIATVSSQVSVPALEPTVTIQAKEVIVHGGKNGREVDARALKQRVLAALSFQNKKSLRIELPVRELTPKLSDEEAQALKEKAQNLIGKRLELKFEFEVFSYSDEQLVGLLQPDGSVDRLKASTLAANVADGVNREPQNATFVFRDGRVQEFTPAKNGVRVQEEKLAEEIAQKIEELMAQEVKVVQAQIPVVATEPQITTEEVNDLGIKELIGRGSSSFRGSIPSRVHNIGLASSRIAGAIVPPGEVFSFNAWLGDVSVYTGYQQAYIIKDGRTVLGDGGGVCQVSTTFFRAALDAGLPIIERHQHSYRVSYYEQDSKPGFDATIYVPSVDLKVKNDTPGHILIQRIFDPRNAKLVFEIYGTDDGREVTISTPRVWDVKAPPPPLYQDDPTLPAGQVKQVDFAAWGGKVAFDYQVTRDGKTIFKRTFYSNYRPWQAVYLRGTAPR